MCVCLSVTIDLMVISFLERVLEGSRVFNIQALYKLERELERELLKSNH